MFYLSFVIRSFVCGYLFFFFLFSITPTIAAPAIARPETIAEVAMIEPPHPPLFSLDVSPGFSSEEDGVEIHCQDLVLCIVALDLDCGNPLLELDSDHLHLAPTGDAGV